MTTFSVRAVIVYLPTPASVGVVDRFQLLRDFFSWLEQALIRFSSKSNNKY